MGDFFAAVPMLLLSIVASYVLGALPLAEQISRRHGVDIFAAGTGLAGASNVRKSVGKWSGLLVLAGDVAKGSLAVLIARFLGVEGPWVLLAASAAIAGHWKSVFTGFKGGDGLATLGGVMLVVFPLHGLISVAIATLVSLGGQRMPYTSLLSIVFGYLTLAILNLAFLSDTALTLGIGGLAAMVLAYASFGHVRRRRETDWDDVGDTGNATEQSGF